MTTPTPLRERLRAVRFQLYRRAPFWAYLLESARIIEDPTRPTACIDAHWNIRINPDFATPLTLEQLQFVLIHEVAHAALLHHSRIQSRDPQLWNVAADVAINHMILPLIPGGTIPGMISRPDLAPDHTTEEIYDLLHDSIPPPSLIQDISLDPPPTGASGQTSGTVIAEPRAPTPTNEAEVRERVARASAQAKLCGTDPTPTPREISEVLDPAIPWHLVLRRFLRHASTSRGHGDYSWIRPSRRPSTLTLPGTIQLAPPTIAFACDTSGSISDTDLAQAFAELRSIQSATSSRVYWLACDAAVHQHGWLAPGTRPPTAGGGGGTDFRPVFDTLATLHLTPDALVFMTDTYGTFPPTAPRYPTLWVTATSSATVPFGTILHIPRKD